ncbi:MAG: hypothetical protein AB7E47_06365 [Desulfovibrionaceae bacterium]
MKHSDDGTSCRVLLSGVDALCLALDVVWQDDGLFTRLRFAKDAAQNNKGTPEPFVLVNDEKEPLFFEVRPHGMRGYEWLLVSHAFSLRFANAKRPGNRPNVYVEIRSESLWHLGPIEAMTRVLDALKRNNAVLHNVKISRLDLCADVLMPEEMFGPELLDLAVCRARDAAMYFRRGQATFLTGIHIGRGAMSARLYDKPREISDRGHKKDWMYSLWNLSEVPEGFKVIRVEFQLRREPLKELGLDSVWSAFTEFEHIWAYCTEKWLKFQDRPGLHHTQRSTLPWWQDVQSNIMGLCGGVPLVREKAIKADERQLTSQALGLLTSLAVLAENNAGMDAGQNVFAAIREVFEANLMQNASRQKLADSVQLKRAKYRRGGSHE